MGETSLKIYKGAAVSIRKSVLAYLLSLKRMQEHIMRIEERREKCDMTEHLIEIEIFTRTSHIIVTKFSPYELRTSR